MKDLILLFGIILGFIFDIISHFFYFKSLRYWRIKKDYFDYLGWGMWTLMSSPKMVKSLEQPGKKYAELAVKFTSLMLITTGIAFIIYLLLSLLNW